MKSKRREGARKAPQGSSDARVQEADVPKRPTHDDFVKKALKDPTVKQRYEELKEAYNLGHKLARKSQKGPMSSWQYLWWAVWANFIGIVIGNGFVTIIKYWLTGKIM